jgi:hypothetical protein
MDRRPEEEVEVPQGAEFLLADYLKPKMLIVGHETDVNTVAMIVIISIKEELTYLQPLTDETVAIRGGIVKTEETSRTFQDILKYAIDPYAVRFPTRINAGRKSWPYWSSAHIGDSRRNRKQSSCG